MSIIHKNEELYEILAAKNGVKYNYNEFIAKYNLLAPNMNDTYKSYYLTIAHAFGREEVINYFRHHKVSLPLFKSLALVYHARKGSRELLKNYIEKHHRGLTNAVIDICSIFINSLWMIPGEKIKLKTLMHTLKYIGKVYDSLCYGMFKIIMQTPYCDIISPHFVYAMYEVVYGTKCNKHFIHDALVYTNFTALSMAVRENILHTGIRGRNLSVEDIGCIIDTLNENSFIHYNIIAESIAEINGSLVGKFDEFYEKFKDVGAYEFVGCGFWDPKKEEHLLMNYVCSISPTHIHTIDNPEILSTVVCDRVISCVYIDLSIRAKYFADVEIITL